MAAAPDLLERLTLARPSTSLLPSYLGFIAEMRAAGDTVWPTRVHADGDDDDAFIARLLAKETTAELPLVTESVFWGVVDGDVVGVIALRHTLTEKLARFGGHVGYEVRPSMRRRGVATGMLRLLLRTERARGIGRLLVTCAPTNVGSRRAIEGAGGRLEGVVFVEDVQRDTCRYWIDVDGA